MDKLLRQWHVDGVSFRLPEGSLRVRQGIAVACCYVLFGKMSTLLALSPGYAAATFPPAGIALAFILLNGARGAPWVFSGAYCLNLWLGWGQFTPVSLVLLPLAIASASTLQAMVGAHLLRLILGNAVRMEHHHDVIMFSVLVPISAFISASISVGCLVGLGLVPNSAFGIQWLAWWLGDTAGMYIFFPVTMAFAGRPKDLWRPRRIAVALPMLVAFALTLMVYVSTRGWELESTLHDFTILSKQAADKLQQSFDSEEFLAEEVAAFMTHRHDMPITRAEFNRFAGQSLKRYPMIQAVEWAPQVSAAERTRFEAEQQREISDFWIRERNAQNEMVVAAPRDMYYPVTYVRPLEGNQAALSYDLASSPERRAALMLAMQNNMPMATAPLNLVQETGKQAGVLLFRPLTSGPNAPGLILTVLRMGDFVDHSLGTERSALKITLLDKTTGRRVYPAPEDFETQHMQIQALHYGGREYTLMTVPSESYLQSHQPWQSLALLSTGMLATSMLGGMLLLVTGSAARTERLVQRRTGELERESRKNILLMRNASDGIHILDERGFIMDASDSFCRMLGYERQQVLGMHVRQWDALMNPTELATKIALALSSDDALIFETQHRRQDGEVFDVEITARTIHVDGRALVFASSRDISERKQNEERILQLAYYDALTNLPNRRLFKDRLEHAMLTSVRSRVWGAVMMLDLDHFKRINDTRGHSTGDEVLVTVAKRIQNATREEATLCRFGGDEFLILLENLDTAEHTAATAAEHVALRIAAAIAHPISVDNGGDIHRITSSIGIALFRGRELSSDVIGKQADMALYQVKNEGRNGIRFFNPSMQAAIDQRIQTEYALEQALQNGELRLYLQAQVDVAGRVIGAEALLRWLHPTRGLVYPDEFIPIAEESGLIIEMGQWVLDTACHQLAVWSKNPQTQHLRLAINVSARQLRQSDFVERVGSALLQSGAPPDHLHMELTESVLIDRPQEIAERMTRLHALGIQFALDDFGTGYSSLAYLQGLPFDQVKIDRAFVSGVSHNGNDSGIVQTILAMSHALGLVPIAEGVETIDQRDFLLRHGCDMFQGYLYGRPIPLERFLHEAFMQPSPSV